MRDDRQWYENAATAEQKRIVEGLHSSGSNMDRKYWVALALYAVLAILVWFTMDAGKVPVFGRPVDLRLVPLIIIGALALKTVLARQAEKIRRGTDSESSEAHRGQV
ncbi:MAG: hypothetical protein ACRD25_00630 [Terracidiphilus sp.]